MHFGGNPFEHFAGMGGMPGGMPGGIPGMPGMPGGMSGGMPGGMPGVPEEVTNNGPNIEEVD